MQRALRISGVLLRVVGGAILLLLVFMFLLMVLLAWFPRAQPEFVGCQFGQPNMEVRDLSAPDSSEAGEGQEAPGYGLGIPGLGGCAIYFDTPRPGAFD
jgi:hypothetical protein